ncbi:MAG TPA: hypothetical protein VK203_10650 [Nostocaceae cyanobacterium]|nr:hypothetical protein [Nostocaceae cyanobacterium]
MEIIRAIASTSAAIRQSSQAIALQQNKRSDRLLIIPNSDRFFIYLIK